MQADGSDRHLVVTYLAIGPQSAQWCQQSPWVLMQRDLVGFPGDMTEQRALLLLLNTETGEDMPVGAPDTGYALSAALSPDGRWVALLGLDWMKPDRALRLVDVVSGRSREIARGEFREPLVW